jgi:putative transposase
MVGFFSELLRNVLSWKLSNSHDTEFSLEALEMALGSGQRCYDNILVERLWRTVKYEEVYLHAYSDDWQAEVSLARFLCPELMILRARTVQ